MTAEPASALLQSATEAEAAGDAAAALDRAWRALDLAPRDVDAKASVVRLLHRYPKLAPAHRREALARLIADPKVDPAAVAPAGWHLLLASGDFPAGPGAAPEAAAARAEADDFTIGLLREAPVTVPGAERALTGLRRWLLLSGRSEDYPRLVSALGAQAALNGGAWLREPDEQARLDAGADPPIAAAYAARRPADGAEAAFVDPVTRAVAGQYRRWPYPAWSRVTARPSTTLPDEIAKRDGGRPSGLPVAADILIAGCGTGREAALTALRYPDARIMAIDLSESALAYAMERCAALGLDNVAFRLLDLHGVAELKTAFDFIACSGVLHHLPDPEAGWAALAAVLKPGGAMRIMVYSRIARLRVRAAQSRIADLRDRPIDEGLLRDARRRLIEAPRNPVADSIDFYTLAGVHDLLFHRHEDPFDVPRIARTLHALGLELLAFALPTAHMRARYRREHPHDPGFRDVEAWAGLEKTQPFLFAGMYEFWCRKPAGHGKPTFI